MKLKKNVPHNTLWKKSKTTERFLTRTSPVRFGGRRKGCDDHLGIVLVTSARASCLHLDGEAWTAIMRQSCRRADSDARVPPNAFTGLDRTSCVAQCKSRAAQCTLLCTVGVHRRRVLYPSASLRQAGTHPRLASCTKPQHALPAPAWPHTRAGTGGSRGISNVPLREIIWAEKTREDREALEFRPCMLSGWRLAENATF